MIREDIPLIQHKPAAVAAPITITPAAAAKLRDVIASKGLEKAGLRVFVSGGGCSGLQYGMAFETQGGEDQDISFSAEGLDVYVDPISIQYVQGAHIDFVDSLMGGGFKIENPNAASSCGCGTSFKPKGEAESAPAAGGGCGCSH
ncbi:MAG: iron-sulfur cluster insertion protein ErpA [Caldilineae bacterium]|nr:iron-sulfur cluster insertion protein ErpA [Chloroflexota bacterium]MCB9177386.1 iron-sulfur cluster insertion protein ErpA [Caldilineae bacterium]